MRPTISPANCLTPHFDLDFQAQQLSQTLERDTMRSPRFAVAVPMLALLICAGRLQTAEPVPAPVVVAPAPPNICDSRWCGTWHSCPTGHNGPLHAHITKVDDCHYHVRFHGRFRTVIPFVYSITLTVTGQE